MKLEKVAIKSKEDHITMTGGAHFHVFVNNETGQELIERTTAEAHAMMKMPGGSFWNPVKPGYTWQYTFGTYEYDTPDGILGEGQYAEDEQKCICRFIGDKQTDVYEVQKEKIVKDVILDSEVDKIKQDFVKKIYGDSLR